MGEMRHVKTKQSKINNWNAYSSKFFGSFQTGKLSKLIQPILVLLAGQLVSTESEIPEDLFLLNMLSLPVPPNLAFNSLVDLRAVNFDLFYACRSVSVNILVQFTYQQFRLTRVVHCLLSLLYLHLIMVHRPIIEHPTQQQRWKLLDISSFYSFILDLKQRSHKKKIVTRTSLEKAKLK